MMGLAERRTSYRDPTRVERDFRRACAEFPTGVTVLTTTVDGEDHGSTVNAFSSLTVDPPQVLACLSNTSRTRTAIEQANVFAVNLLAGGQADIAKLFASKEDDKFARIRYRRAGLDVPLIEGAVATFECRLVESVESYSHAILIGEVLDFSIRSGREPLTFFRGRIGRGIAGPDDSREN
ncbi:flavin reductase [Nocardioides sp. LMS-CY]|uniref:Flavin reductase (DIM6/NTAB) family NADH-FMN oxidoreductase RutF n=1 Tax=Nocardioides soli TaxID=1036020 RepID=A0A7W4YZU3_9ACTN|nr:MULTISPECIES: flavin reductase family protein [Nocardioides]MBB3041118.1 flavin reductase (DIM6/NTAB) family NADH-FMN oxidoreductase RutF [Nocardioides soli]QWF23565.1 flavin reductase [Nocardioides sp. LMS-CY]